MQAASHVSSLTLLALLVLASGFCRAQGLSDLVNSSQHQVVSGQHNSTVPVHSVEQSGPSPKLEGGSNSSVSASQKQPGFQQDNQTSNNLRGFQTCSNSATFPPALWQDDHCPAADTDEDSTVTTSEAGHTHATIKTESAGSVQNVTDPAKLALETASEQQQPQQQQPHLQQDLEETGSVDEERHNFALSKDGAKIVACNREAKKCSAILDTDSDTFMRNDCKADKWFIVELSQVAKVDALQLSQYELYSSRVKDFEVRGRQSHPRAQGSDYSKALNTSGWQLLGKYTAAKTRGSQAFTVAQPVWAKYLQFHFMTHHGSEPMCALNDVLVFGKSAAEDLEDQLSDNSLSPDDIQQTTARSDPTPQVKAGPQPEANTSPKPAGTEQQASTGQPLVPLAGASLAQLSHGVTEDSGQLNTSASASWLNMSGHPDQQRKLPEEDKLDEPEASQANAEPSTKASPAIAHAEVQNNSNHDNAAVAPQPSPDLAQADALHDELLLLPNSASSSKARHGGSVYDMLVQEIKSLKLQQKLAIRQLAELQRNISADLNKATSDYSAMQHAVQALQTDFKALEQSKHSREPADDSEVATVSDADIHLRDVLEQMESVKMALHIVQHRVTAIVLMAIVAWLAVMVLTAPDLGRMTWILWVPMVMICAIGVLWLAGMLRILPNHFTVR